MRTATEGAPNWNVIVNGQYKSTDTAVHAGPNVAAQFFRIQALSGNVGSIYLGGVAGTTVSSGATDTTTGAELTPGQSDNFYVGNLNLLNVICPNSGDGFTYLGYR